LEKTIEKVVLSYVGNNLEENLVNKRIPLIELNLNNPFNQKIKIMKKTSYLITLLILLTSCKQIDSKSNFENNLKIEMSNSIEGIIYNQLKLELDEAKNLDGIYQNHKYNEHRKQILESIKIVEQVEIPKLDLIAVFYNYYVGTDIIRKTKYVKKEGNNYYIFYKYFSSYDDDPFKNGEPKKGKELMKKIDNWTEGNKDIDWFSY